MHYVAVRAMEMCKQYHVVHDASTKKWMHILHTCVTCEVETVRGFIAVKIPIKFQIFPSGEADKEAEQIQAAFHCSVGDG